MNSLVTLLIIMFIPRIYQIELRVPAAVIEVLLLAILPNLVKNIF